MSLALVISSLSSGGAERVMSELANFWAARGETVTLVTLDGWATDSYILHPHVRRVALGLMSDSGGGWAALRSNYRRVAALRTALLASRAPVVLSFEARTNVLVILATAGTRLRRVVSERINPSEHAIGRVWTVLRRITYPIADALVVQTRVALPWATAIMLGRRRAHVIPNPLRDMQAFRNVGPDASSHTIVAIGRLAHQKGFDILLRAFALIAKASRPWKLTIIGEGGERGPLEALASSLGIADRVALPGWHSEPGEALKTAGLFVMSSRYEGFPNALLEAMACGVPVVSAAWAGSAEIITNDVDGWVVPGDVEHISAAMQRLIDEANTRARLGRNALAVVDRYRLNSVVKQWDALLAAPCRRLVSLKFYS